jgi:PKD repeat protein
MRSHAGRGFRRIGFLALASLGSISASARGQAVSLTDLPVQANRESDKLPPNEGKYPALFIDKTQDGKPLAVGDKSYDKGLEAVHGSLSWSYGLDGKYTSLVTDLGQDGTATVRILGDGNLLYDSGQLPRRVPLTAMVDVRGVKELQIAVIDNDGGFWNDRVFFGNPALLTRPQPDAKDTPGTGSTPGTGGTPAPLAVMAVTPANGSAPLEVKFSGDQSKAPAGQVGRYTWYFGDGATETLSPNPTHTFTAPGIYEVLLQVEDNNGGLGVTRQLVTVRPSGNQPPIAMAKTSARVIRTGESIQFDGSASSSADGAITSYQWDFGDGQTDSGMTPKHVYTQPGRYSAALTVANKAGEHAKVAVAIRVMGPNDSLPFPLPQKARVLIIGNSLIGFCGPIDGWLTIFDKMSPQPLGLVCQSRGKGLGKLVEYATWSRLAIHDKIDEGWDAVIIQPWLDAIDPNVSDAQLLKNCKTLVDWSREVGAYPVLYEPQMGWQNFSQDQATAHQRIGWLAQQLDTGFIPGGQAWARVADDFPMKTPGHGRGMKETDPATFDGLMYSDFGHQSFTGALFNSMMIWRYLTGQSMASMTVSPTGPVVEDKARQLVVWSDLPYLEKVGDEVITPASQRVR